MRCITLLACVGILAALSARPIAGGEREALLIGNSKYAGSAVLGNPGKDADAMESALKALGFSVTKHKDLDLGRMEESLVAFRRTLRSGGLAMFFYAGHGVQVNGVNYLVPIGADLQEEFQVRRRCLDVGQVLDLMSEAEVNLKVVILDCCRDNPFQRSWSRGSSKKGLASISEIPKGTLIAFSTAPNQTAADGRGDTSPYTEHLVAVLRSRPSQGLELIDAFREAGQAVAKANNQSPWLNFDLSLGKYYLWNAPLSQPVTTPSPGPSPPKAEREKIRQVEVVFIIRDGGENGPELAGAEASLRWLASENAAPAVLGRAKSDQSGRAKIAASLSGPQLAGGSFEVLLTSRDASKTWVLPGFPRSLEWDVWLPRASASSPPQSPMEKPSLQPPGPQQREVTNSIGMKLVLIPADEFLMGSPDSEAERQSDEGPQHRVRITKPFYLGKYEVTQGEYERVMGTNPSNFKEVSGEDTSRFPVEQVSWDEAVEFCRKLSQQERRTYRLPTEAEWEYACRGGTTTPFSFGSVLNGAEANCDGNYPYGTSDKGPYLRRTKTVGSYRPNAFGLYDMHGNVYEWCGDWYDSSYYTGSPHEDPTGPSGGSYRVLRGGSWNLDAGSCRSASRFGLTPDDRYGNLGFRVSQVPAD